MIGRTDTRPDLARELRLPQQTTLDYWRAAAMTIVFVAIALYIVTLAVRRPRAIARALRKRVGA